MSEDSLRQELYFFDFSVLLYFMNDQFSILNYCFPVLSAELGTWQVFPLERNVPSLSWSAEVDACSRFGCLVPVLEPKLITRCAPAQGKKKKKSFNLVFLEKNRFTAGFSLLLSLGVLSSN